MAEQIVVWTLVGFVVLLVGRRLKRVLTSASGGCGCGSRGCGQGGYCDPTTGVKMEAGEMLSCVDVSGSQDKHVGL